MQMRGQGDLYVSEERAKASAGAHPPPPPPTTAPENLPNSQHQIWGDSGSCLASPHRCLTVGSQITSLNGEWRNTPFHQVPGAGVGELIDTLRGIRREGGPHSLADAMVEEIPPCSNGPWHTMQHSDDKVCLVFGGATP